MLSISIMVEKPCAVHCDSEEQGKMIVDAVRESYPEMAKLWNPHGDNHWGNFKDKTCYTLYDESYDGELKLDRLYYCNREFYEERGYEIIEFDELLSEDIEIADSDMSIEDLLGI